MVLNLEYAHDKNDNSGVYLKMGYAYLGEIMEKLRKNHGHQEKSWTFTNKREIMENYESPQHHTARNTYV
jgi:hypothetical protein